MTVIVSNKLLSLSINILNKFHKKVFVFNFQFFTIFKEEF